MAAGSRHRHPDKAGWRHARGETTKARGAASRHSIDWAKSPFATRSSVRRIDAVLAQAAGAAPRPRSARCTASSTRSGRAMPTPPIVPAPITSARWRSSHATRSRPTHSPRTSGFHPAAGRPSASLAARRLGFSWPRHLRGARTLRRLVVLFDLGRCRAQNEPVRTLLRQTERLQPLNHAPGTTAHDIPPHFENDRDGGDGGKGWLTDGLRDQAAGGKTSQAARGSTVTCAGVSPMKSPSDWIAAPSGRRMSIRLAGRMR